MIYYFGPAQMIDRKIELSLFEERKSKVIVQYKLEERMMGINRCRYTYTMGILDCPRPKVEPKKKKPKAASAIVQKPLAG